MAGPFHLPPGAPSWLFALVKRLEQHLEEEPGAQVLGISDGGAGTDVTLTFEAKANTPFVRVHVQSTDTGGESYDDSTFISSTRKDTRGDKRQSVTISRPNADEFYYVYLIPEIEVPQGSGSFTKLDGVDGPDRMTFVNLSLSHVVGGRFLLDLAIFGHKESPSDDDFRWRIESGTNGQVSFIGEFWDAAEGSWFTGGQQIVMSKDEVVVSFLEDTGGGNVTVHQIYRYDETDFSFNTDVENPNAFDQQGTMTLGAVSDLELAHLLATKVNNG